MRVYRVEHASTKLGPYTHSRVDESIRLVSEIDDMIYEHNDTHPQPEDDGICGPLLNRPTSLCGFLSKEMLENWFDGYLDCLIKNDFLIVEIEVPEKYIELGRRQLIFNKEKILNKTDVTNEFTGAIAQLGEH